MFSHKMKMPKVRLHSYDYKAYGVKKPLNGILFGILVFLISALDFCTIRSAIDSEFNTQSGSMNNIISWIIVFVLDILTITISDSIFASKSAKKAIPRVTLVVVAATVICTIIYRMMSVDTIFAPDTTSNNEEIKEIVENLITQPETATTPKVFHATSGQKFLNAMLSFLPIATSLFGINVSQKRAQALKQKYIIRNRKEINLLNTRIFEVSEYDKNFDEDTDNLEKKENMENQCESLFRIMESEKNNALSQKLNDPQSATYISQHSQLIDFDAIKNPQKSNNINNNVSQNITQTQSSTTMPLTQQSF